ncbi:hypothetical protein [Flagellimonas sp.]|uniref:hypothetical protein n=1 Tax=Flagellimonas sp. TaxID=2058762 RepID=UPI003B51E21F
MTSRNANANEIGERLSVITSEFIHLDIANNDGQADGLYFSNYVYMITSLINFIHELEKVSCWSKKSFQDSNLKAS